MVDILTFFKTHLPALQHRDFLIDLFTETDPEDYPEDGKVDTLYKAYPGKLFVKDGKVVHAVKFEGKKILEVEAGPEKKKEVYLTAQDKITLEKGELENVSAKTETTIGRVCANYILLCIPFGNRIPFQNKTLKGFDKLVGDLVLRPKDPKDLPPPSCYQKYAQAVQYFLFHPEYFAGTLSPKSLTAFPGMKEEKAKLLEKNKKAIEAGSVKAMVDVEQELLKKDKKYLEGDPSLVYYHSSWKKLYSNCRKNMFITVGPQANPLKPGTYENVPNSLEQGMTVASMPGAANTNILASVGRALETAKGGADSKGVARAAQNVRVNMVDCGSKVTKSYTIDDVLGSDLVGRTFLHNGKPTLFTKDMIAKAKGHTLNFRTSQYCHGKDSGYCFTCLQSGYKQINQQFLGMGLTRFGEVFSTEALKKSHNTTQQISPLGNLNQYVIEHATDLII